MITAASGCRGTSFTCSLRIIQHIMTYTTSCRVSSIIIRNRFSRFGIIFWGRTCRTAWSKERKAGLRLDQLGGGKKSDGLCVGAHEGCELYRIRGLEMNLGKYFPFVIFGNFCNYSVSYFGCVKYGFCRNFSERSSCIMC